MNHYLNEEMKEAVDEETPRASSDGSICRLKWIECHDVKSQRSLCLHKTSDPTDKR